jgi:hypothetical protein
MIRLPAIVVLFLVAAPRVGRGQEPSLDRAMRASVEVGLAARSVAGGPVWGLPAAPPLAPRRRHDRSLGVTLMLIGGGAVVVGAVTGGGGGTVLVVGGLVCAGYGFYLYTE